MYAVFNKSKLTMHTDKVYLGKLPIKKTTKEKQKEIINLVKKMNKNNLKKTLPELDKKVYKLYGITKTEQNKISEALKQIMSEKSLW
jgi:mevalonate kinase